MRAKQEKIHTAKSLLSVCFARLCLAAVKQHFCFVSLAVNVMGAIIGRRNILLTEGRNMFTNLQMATTRNRFSRKYHLFE